MAVKHFLSITDLTSSQLADILYLTKRLKSNPKKHNTFLDGKTVCLLFNKPSTRTRVSFETSIHQLGGSSIFMTEREIQIGRGESIKDTALVLSRYLTAIIIRTYSHEHVIEYARNSAIPVINGLTDLLHPCQILSDIYTIIEKKQKIKGINLTYIGDGSNNIAHTWLLAAGKTGINLKIATPREYQPKKEIIEEAQSIIDETKMGAITITDDPLSAAKDADILYTDVWVSMGQEAEEKERLTHFTPYQINTSLLNLAKKDCQIMHCLPAHPGCEITEDLLYSNRSIVFDQAENRLHAQKALLFHLLAK